MTLLFDFGGVLVDLDKQRCIRAFADLGFDIRPYLGTFRQAGFFSQLERGEITVSEFCRTLRDLIRKDNGSAAAEAVSDAQIVSAWEKYLLDVPEERLEMLLKLRRHYPVCVLSNTNSVHWNQAENGYFQYKGLHVEDFFDQIFLSFEMGVEKPDLEIFHRVAHAVGGDPADILFFDDSEVNCRAARDAGLSARIAPAGGVWLDYFDEDGKYLEMTE